MPNDAAIENGPAPLAELEPETDIEAAYYEQLERQVARSAETGYAPLTSPGFHHQHNENYFIVPSMTALSASSRVPTSLIRRRHSRSN